MRIACQQSGQKMALSRLRIQSSVNVGNCIDSARLKGKQAATVGHLLVEASLDSTALCTV